MRSFFLTVVAIAGFVLGGAGQTPSTVEVRGVLRDAATGKVLRGASVQIGTLYNSSDVDGRFSISGVLPGKQLLTVFHSSYVLAGIHKPEQGRKPVYRESGIGIFIPPGSPFEMDVYMNLAPAVSGTVVDLMGQPVEGASVTPYRFTYDTNGEKTVIRAYRASLTDDRGQFPIEPLAPGDYVFRAGNDLLVRKIVVPTYYPATMEFPKAETVSVRFGDDIQLRPLILQSAPLFWLTAKLVDEAGEEIGLPSVWVRRNGEIGELATRALASNLLRLPPGSYEVGARELSLGPRAGVGGPSETRLAYTSSIEVRDKDVTVPLTIPVGTKTTLRVLQEKSGEMKPVPDVSVRFVPKDAPFGLPSPFGGTTGADGTFSVALPRGTHRVTPRLNSEVGERESKCVREIRLGDASITNDEIGIQGTAARVSLILRDATTLVQGHLGAIGADATVALVPDDRKQTQRYVATIADHDGNFDFKCALPGSYRLYAWTSVPGDAYRNEEFMMNYRDQGTPIRVSEGAPLTVQTTLIEQ